VHRQATLGRQHLRILFRSFPCLNQPDRRRRDCAKTLTPDWRSLHLVRSWTPGCSDSLSAPDGVLISSLSIDSDGSRASSGHSYRTSGESHPNEFLENAGYPPRVSEGSPCLAKYTMPRYAPEEVHAQTAKLYINACQLAADHDRAGPDVAVASFVSSTAARSSAISARWLCCCSVLGRRRSSRTAVVRD
jgi:hypothetical protein